MTDCKILCLQNSGKDQTILMQIRCLVLQEPGSNWLQGAWGKRVGIGQIFCKLIVLQVLYNYFI